MLHSSIPPNPYPWYLQTPNRPPLHDLPQACGGSKSVCQIFIWPTDNLQSHPGKTFRTNELWSNQCQCQPCNSLCRSELIKYWWKVCMPNRHPCHKLLQVYRKRKYVCPVLKWHTEKFPQKPSTSIRINKLWSDQFQSTITQQHIKNLSLGIEPRTIY